MFLQLRVVEDCLTKERPEQISRIDRILAIVVDGRRGDDAARDAYLLELVAPVGQALFGCVRVQEPRERRYGLRTVQQAHLGEVECPILGGDFLGEQGDAVVIEAKSRCGFPCPRARSGGPIVGWLC